MANETNHTVVIGASFVGLLLILVVGYMLYDKSKKTKLAAAAAAAAANTATAQQMALLQAQVRAGGNYGGGVGYMPNGYTPSVQNTYTPPSGPDANTVLWASILSGLGGVVGGLANSGAFNGGGGGNDYGSDYDNGDYYPTGDNATGGGALAGALGW